MDPYCSILSDKSHYKAPFSCEVQHHGKNKQLKLDSCERTTTISVSLIAGILFPVIGGVLAFYGLSALYKHRKIKKLNDSKVDFTVSQIKWPAKAPKSGRSQSHSISSSDSTPKPDDQKPKAPVPNAAPTPQDPQPMTPAQPHLGDQKHTVSPQTMQMVLLQKPSVPAPNARRASPQLAVPTTWDGLPIEAKSEIFSYLPQHDRLKVERVCKAWQKDMTQATLSGISREARIAWDNLMDIFVNNSFDRTGATNAWPAWTLSVCLEEDTGLLTSLHLSGRRDGLQIAKPQGPVREYEFNINFISWVRTGGLSQEAYHLTIPLSTKETLSDVVVREMLIQLNYSANLIWKEHVENYKLQHPDEQGVSYMTYTGWGYLKKLVPYPIDKNRVARIRQKRLRVAARILEPKYHCHPRKVKASSVKGT